MGANSTAFWRPILLLSLASVLMVSAAGAADDSMTAPEVMKRVAQNQDREQKERESFVYEEHVRIATRFKNGKLAREERADYLVTPTAKGTIRKRTAIEGRYARKGHYIDFKGEPTPETGGLDEGLVSSFREDLLDKKSKDSMGSGLFPLTTKGQKDLEFEMAGETVVKERPAYRIRFKPSVKDDFGWAGEALIDREEFQPVSIFTGLSRRIPFFVRNLLGTDVPGLGFHTQYVRVGKDVWFPASFGAEFRIHAVFFINRTVTVSLENKNFRRAVSSSEIHYGEQQ